MKNITVSIIFVATLVRMPILAGLLFLTIPFYIEQSYQQRPQPPEGGLLKRNWIKNYIPEELPPLEKLKIYQAWDLAISTRETTDYTVCTTVGVSQDKQIYLLDWYRDRIDFPTQVKMVTMLTDQIDGELELDKTEGTTFKITFAETEIS